MRAGQIIGAAVFAAMLAAAAPMPAAAQPQPQPQTLSIETQVQNVAQSAVACKGLSDFYWEIGDAKGALVSGRVGSHVTADTNMRLDSASKIVFGAYALEKRGDKPLTPGLVNLFRMTAGYSHGSHGFLSCTPRQTVAHCARAVIGKGPYAKDAGKFSYGGAHSMALGLALGLGDKTGKDMEADYKKYLGDDTHFTFASMVFAGGLKSTPAHYAVFLRKILNKRLRIYNDLGAFPVCAGKTGCPAGTVAYSPAPRAWHYSLLHWVEDDKQGDGAFSSPGLEGFYPWISADKKYYGILARQKFSASAALESVTCGNALRAVFMRAVHAP
jgi:hypothetical protein